jgi:hypothetical protein
MQEFKPKNNPVRHYQPAAQPKAKNSSDGFFFEKMFKKIFKLLGGFFKGLGQLWKFSPKKAKWIVMGIIIVLFGVWGTMKIIHHFQEKHYQLYEALVMPTDQKNPDPVEDAKSSLKRGDVIAIFPAGHQWSQTEEYSYLVIKIKLSPAEAAELVQPKMQVAKQQIPSGAPAGPKGQKPPPQMETVLARQYRLKIPNFDLQKFWGGGGQPFTQTFDDGLIQKK